MSMTSDRSNHHLTASGWVLGTYSMDSVMHSVPVPSDCVLTVQQHTHRQGYQYDETITLKKLWSSDDQVAIDRLTAMYGEWPKVEEPFIVPRRKK